MQRIRRPHCNRTAEAFGESGGTPNERHDRSRAQRDAVGRASRLATSHILVMAWYLVGCHHRAVRLGHGECRSRGERQGQGKHDQGKQPPHGRHVNASRLNRQLQSGSPTALETVSHCIANSSICAETRLFRLSKRMQNWEKMHWWVQSHCRGQGFDSPQLHQPRSPQRCSKFHSLARLTAPEGSFIDSAGTADPR